MCGCLEQITKKMQEQYPGADIEFKNVTLNTPSKVFVEVKVKNFKQGKIPKLTRPLLVGEYCPFCGQKYEEGNNR